MAVPAISIMYIMLHFCSYSTYIWSVTASQTTFKCHIAAHAALEAYLVFLTDYCEWQADITISLSHIG